MKPLTRYYITLFGGILGIHKYMDGQIKWGLIYTFTAGLFLIGWIRDMILAINLCRSQELSASSKKVAVGVSSAFILILILGIFGSTGEGQGGSFNEDSNHILLESSKEESSKEESSVSMTLQVNDSKEESEVGDSSSAFEESREESYAMDIDESSEEEQSTQESLEESSEEESVSEEVEISLISITSPISAGSTASITVQGEPDTDYSITVMYSSGPSSADGLETKMSDSDGIVSWSWKIGARTKEGTYRISISGGGKSFSTSIEIT